MHTHTRCNNKQLQSHLPNRHRVSAVRYRRVQGAPVLTRRALKHPPQPRPALLAQQQWPAQQTANAHPSVASDAAAWEQTDEANKPRHHHKHRAARYCLSCLSVVGQQQGCPTPCRAHCDATQTPPRRGRWYTFLHGKETAPTGNPQTVSECSTRQGVCV